MLVFANYATHFFRKMSETSSKKVIQKEYLLSVPSFSSIVVCFLWLKPTLSIYAYWFWNGL